MLGDLPNEHSRVSTRYVVFYVIHVKIIIAYSNLEVVIPDHTSMYPVLVLCVIIR